MQNTSIISFFWRHIKPYKWLYLVMLAAPLTTSFSPFATNYAIKIFLDSMAHDHTITYQTLLFPISLFMGTQGAMSVVWTLSQIAELKAEPYVRRSILLDSYRYVIHHSYQFFQDNFTGSIGSKIKGILDGYDKFWEEMHHGLMLNVLRSVVSISALSLVNLDLGIFVLLWAVFYVLVMYRMSMQLHNFSFIETESRHRLIGLISDTVTNIISLLSFSARQREYRTLDKTISDEFVPKQIRTYRYDVKLNIVGWFFYFILYFFVLFYVIHLRIIGAISIGDFAFVFGLILIVTEDIWIATISLQDFARSMGDLKSCFSILHTPQQGLDPAGALPLTMKTPKIEFKKVNFSYGSKLPVLKDFSLTIQPGEKVGFVGYSGAGKSSLVNLLLKYFRIHKGNILISDQDIDAVTQDSVREQIAVIPQDTLLFHRTLMDNIRYGKPTATDAEVIEASKKAHLHDFIMSLPEKYQSYAGERGIKLSGGQRQRIAIARAILKDSPILILDEATSALDSQTEKLIQESLNFLIANKQKTVIAIAHRLSTLKHMDRIIVLDKGRILEEGTHGTLIRNKGSLYKKLWDLQELQ